MAVHAVADAPDGRPWYWVAEGVRCACPAACKAHGGGSMVRMCFSVGGGGACGVQQRNLSPLPWSVNCPDCWRHPDFKAADAAVRQCPRHDASTIPGVWTCPTCDAEEKEMFE